MSSAKARRPAPLSSGATAGPPPKPPSPVSSVKGTPDRAAVGDSSMRRTPDRAAAGNQSMRRALDRGAKGNQSMRRQTPDAPPSPSASSRTGTRLSRNDEREARLADEVHMLHAFILVLHLRLMNSGVCRQRVNPYRLRPPTQAARLAELEHKQKASRPVLDDRTRRIRRDEAALRQQRQDVTALQESMAD
eukprot:gene7525-7037_t